MSLEWSCYFSLHPPFPSFFFLRLSEYWLNFLSVGLGDTLDLVLLLDRIAVGRVLGGVDELVSKALSDGLDVAESRLSRLYVLKRKKSNC